MHFLNPWRRAALAATLLASTALTGLAFTIPSWAQPGPVNPPAMAAPQAVLPDFSGLVAQVKPAVVSITTIIKAQQSEGESAPLPFPFN